MGVVTKGTAVVIDKNTGEAFEIQSAELDWQPQEPAPGTEPGQRHVAQVDHPVLGTLIWSIWEYPGTSENIRETDPNGHSIEQDFEYWFESGEDMGTPAAVQDNRPAMKPKAKAGPSIKVKTKAKPGAKKPKPKIKPKAVKKKPAKKAKAKKPLKKTAKKKTAKKKTLKKRNRK